MFGDAAKSIVYLRTLASIVIGYDQGMGQRCWHFDGQGTLDPPLVPSFYN